VIQQSLATKSKALTIAGRAAPVWNPVKQQNSKDNPLTEEKYPQMRLLIATAVTLVRVPREMGSEKMIQCQDQQNMS
jgi:hypothetical protein